jgi:hypothetical protein
MTLIRGIILSVSVLSRSAFASTSADASELTEINLVTDSTAPRFSIPHLSECPQLLSPIGSGWTSDVYSSRFHGEDVAIKVYPMLNVSHFAINEIDVYNRLEPLWGKCVPSLRFYGICDDGPAGKPVLVLATTMLGHTLATVQDVSDHLKYRTVDCMQQIMLIGGVTRIDYTLTNALLTRDGSSVQWVDFAFSTLMDSFMGVSSDVERRRLANAYAVKYTNLLWEKLGLADEPHYLRTKAETLFVAAPTIVVPSGSSIVWPLMPVEFDSVITTLVEEPVSWISPRTLGVSHWRGRRVLVMLYGFDFAMFGHYDLSNLMRLSEFQGECIPAIAGFGLTGVQANGERKMAIVLDLPEKWTLQTASPTLLKPTQKANAMACLDRLHSAGLVNGYIRALDILTNEEDDAVMWNNFGFAVSDNTVYDSFDVNFVPTLIEAEKIAETHYISRALDDPETVEIY